MDDRRRPGDPDQHFPPEQRTGEWMVAEPDRPAATGWAWRTGGDNQPRPARWHDDAELDDSRDSGYPYRPEPPTWRAAPPAGPADPRTARHRQVVLRSPAGSGLDSDRHAAPGEEPDLRPPAGPALYWTVAAFVLPLLAYLGWVWSLSTQPRPGCVDATGAACPGPRAQAMANLSDALPALAVALGLALVLAVVIRRIAFTWRGYKVGFAAGVIAAGLVTLGAAALG